MRANDGATANRIRVAIVLAWGGLAGDQDRSEVARSTQNQIASPSLTGGETATVIQAPAFSPAATFCTVQP